jgi:hypothetical protein
MKPWQFILIVVAAVTLGTGANVWYARRAISEKEKSLNQRLEALEKSLSESTKATASNTLETVSVRLNDVRASLAAQIQAASSNTSAEVARQLEALEGSLTARLDGLSPVSNSQSRLTEWPSKWRILFQDQFKGSLTWTTSNKSVSIKDNDFLVIDSDGHNDDWAEKDLSIDLSPDHPIIIEQRLKLQSAGLNYRLPLEEIVFENSSSLSITYLPNFPDKESVQPYGWNFGGWTGNHDHAVPGSGYWTSAIADYWAVTRVVITPTEGELYVKPDDHEKGWFSDQFFKVASQKWSHSKVEKIRFKQPWDSVVYIDYVKVGSPSGTQ